MNPLATFEIDYNSGLPVWIQAKNRIASLIGTGEYAPGDRLPTVRALAVDLDISYNTVNRAYMDLEREGYITTRKGRGTFVAERREVGADRAADTAVESGHRRHDPRVRERGHGRRRHSDSRPGKTRSPRRGLGSVGRQRPVPRRSGCSRIADGSIFCCDRLRHLNNRSIIYVDGYGCGDEARTPIKRSELAVRSLPIWSRSKGERRRKRDPSGWRDHDVRRRCSMAGRGRRRANCWRWASGAILARSWLKRYGQGSGSRRRTRSGVHLVSHCPDDSGARCARRRCPRFASRGYAPVRRCSRAGMQPL